MPWHCGVPSQNSSLSIHSMLPHANFPFSQNGSSVARWGATSLGSYSLEKKWSSINNHWAKNNKESLT